MTEADYARSRGWNVGTYLVGDEGYGPTVIQITALALSKAIARTVSHNGIPEGRLNESSWTFRYRDWQVCDENGNYFVKPRKHNDTSILQKPSL